MAKWEYTSFPVDGDVILIKDDRLADALTVLPQSLRTGSWSWQIER